jgi:hypothetical protein
MKFRDSQESLNSETFFMSIFEFIGEFYFQNDIFKLLKVVSELEIRAFLENGLENFQKFLILQI